MRAVGQLDRGEALAPITDLERLGRGQDGPAEIHTLALPYLQPLGLRPQRVPDAVGGDHAPVSHVVADGFVGQIPYDGSENAVPSHFLHQGVGEALIGIHGTYVVRHELKKLNAERRVLGLPVGQAVGRVGALHGARHRRRSGNQKGWE